MANNGSRARAGYDAANRESAAIVLADIERYGGEESLLVRWARLVLTPPATRSKPAIARAA